MFETDFQKPTEFFMEYEYLVDKFKDFKAIYDEKGTNKDFNQEVFKITDTFLRQDPTHYIKFGPYWWAVKSIMQSLGFDGYNLVGADRDVLEAYSYRNDNGEVDNHATIVAAWLFKDYYNDTYIQGNRDYDLWANGDTFKLYDEEWENSFE